MGRHGIAIGRRVRRPAGMEELEAYFVGRGEKASGRGVFPRLVDLLAFAAVYAAARGESEPLKGEHGEAIPEHIFETDYAGLFYALALFREPSSEALGDEWAEKRVDVFEAYANAGMQLIRESISFLSPPEEELERLLRDSVPQLNRVRSDEGADQKDLVAAIESEFDG